MIFSGPIQVIVNAVDRAIGANGAKRLGLMIGSGFLTVVCFVLIRCWTYVPSYTHIIFVNHPFSADTSSTHFVTADVEIMTHDGYLVYGNKDETHKMTRSCVFHYSHGPKDSLIKRPEKSTVEGINQYMSFPLVSETGGNLTVPVSHAANVSMFCHSFSTGSEMLVKPSPLVLDSIFIKDDDGVTHMQYMVHSLDDNNVLQSKDYKIIMERLPNFYLDERSGRLIQSYASVLTDSTKQMASIGHSVDRNNMSFSEKCNYHFRQFVKFHDISRCNYFVYMLSSGIDSLNVRLSFYENADIVHSAQKTGKNYVEYSMTGDPVSANGVTFFTGSARLLESENTQLVRLFAVTTLCAFFFGYFLKYLVKILLSIKFHRKKVDYEG